MRTLLLVLCLAVALLGGSTAQSDDAGKIFSFIRDKGVTPPKVLRNPMPAFTEKARKERIQGVVMISGYVGSDGSITMPRSSARWSLDLTPTHWKPLATGNSHPAPRTASP